MRIYLCSPVGLTHETGEQAYASAHAYRKHAHDAVRLGWRARVACAKLVPLDLQHCMFVCPRNALICCDLSGDWIVSNTDTHAHCMRHNVYASVSTHFVLCDYNDVSGVQGCVVCTCIISRAFL